jgi:trk system potassium uptake protein TrkA
MPTGDLVVKVGDVMVVFAVRSSVRQLEQMFRVSMDFF